MGLADDKAAYYERLARTPGDDWDQFGSALVTERTPIIELNSSYGVSALRDVTTVTGTGAVAADSGGEIKVNTGTTAGSTADLASASRGRYVPGYGAELGIGVRIPTQPAGDATMLWGGLDEDEDDGFYFGYDSTGLYVAVRRNSVETEKVYRTSWNLDQLDGLGPSGYNLDVTDGIIYQIKFTWYGYGQILWGIVVTDGSEQQRFIAVHSYRPTGTTSVQTPNLAIHAQADNGTETVDYEMNVGGRSYSVVGKYVPKNRSVGQARGSVNTSTTDVPLVSLRYKTGFNDRSAQLAEVAVIPATEPCVIEVRLDASLTGASWATPTNHTAAETAFEADVSATAVSGGTVIYTSLAAAGAANKFSTLSTQLSELDIPAGSTVTLTARTLSGTGTILSHLRLVEEW